MKSLMTVSIVALVTAGAALAHGPQHHAGHADHTGAAYGQPGDPSKPSRQIVVVMKEADGKMLFEPSRVEIKLGEQITFKLDNAGELDHEFLLGTAEEIEEHADMMKAMPDMQHDDPNAKRLAPKTKGDLVWSFTKPGEFDFACLIPGYREAGMAGKIIVK
jgi:uncharacterized cupredoxin-like copper-binding protein